MIDETTTCYLHPDRPAATGCQRCGRPICSGDMRQAAVGFHCPRCVANDGQRVYRARDLQFQPQVTIGLIALNVLAYFAQQGSVGVTNDGLLFGPAVVDGEYWRLLTGGFLHGSLIHIGFNMYLLWLLGRPLEQAFGPFKYLLMYFGALFGGSAAVMFFNWGTPTLGASGAVLGLAGAMGAIYAARGFDVRQSPAFGLVVINLLLPVLIPRISFWGHLGGVAAGALVAYTLVWLPERKLIPPGAAVPLTTVVVVALAALGVVGAQVG